MQNNDYFKYSEIRASIKPPTISSPVFSNTLRIPVLKNVFHIVTDSGVNISTQAGDLFITDQVP